jgi:lipoate-protein ligase A
MVIGRILDQKHLLNDVYYNLAVDHAVLLEHATNSFAATIRLWKNPQAVIIGRNQDLEQEVNLEYCSRNNILIGRRITGGGAVYQDEGNLNISFTFPKGRLPKECKNLVQITEFFTDVLLESLEAANLTNLHREGHSNIYYEKKKISGSAGYLRNQWILHHATLLLSAQLEHLNNSLLARPGYGAKKGRESRYSSTTNLPTYFDIASWQTKLISIIANKLNTEFQEANLLMQEYFLAKKLSNKMYSQESWIINQKRVF